MYLWHGRRLFGAEQETEPEAEQEELQLYARAALLMDASNNRVLYEKNGYEVLPMASTTHSEPHKRQF